MREIKFRAFLKSNKLMYDVLTVDIIDSKVLIENKENQLRGYAKYSEIELMQYTGLKDKNRENIYEGDILYWTDKSELSDETLSEKAEVFWNKELLRWSVKIKIFNKTHISDLSDYDNQEEIEVIGNIYENPELLEE